VSTTFTFRMTRFSWIGFVAVVTSLIAGPASANDSARESPPEFSYDLYSDKQGHFSYDGAALALVKRPSHLQRVYADAARGEARPRQLIQELEYWFQQTGLAVADRTAALGCLVLPELQSNCRPPNWGFIEQFLGNSPEGVRLREVLAEAYARRAHQLGVRNDVTVAGVNLLLVGSLAKAVLARVGVVEARTAGQKFLVPEANAARGVGLAAHEAAGGHLIARHVGKTGADLATRLAAQPGISAASTFASGAEAEAGAAAVLGARAGQLSSWVSAGAQGRLILEAPFAGGQVLVRGATTPVTGSAVKLVLEGTGGGAWRIVTGYPLP
jgi:hypothetical protein